VPYISTTEVAFQQRGVITSVRTFYLFIFNTTNNWPEINRTLFQCLSQYPARKRSRPNNPGAHTAQMMSTGRDVRLTLACTCHHVAWRESDKGQCRQLHMADWMCLLAPPPHIDRWHQCLACSRPPRHRIGSYTPATIHKKTMRIEGKKLMNKELYTKLQ